MVPVNTVLQNGDVVEAITSNTAKGPSRDWLKFVKTPSAKSKIKSFFKKEMREDNIKRGKDMLETAAKHKGFAFADLAANQKWRDYVCQKYNFTDLDELFAMVGYGELTTAQVMQKLLEFNKRERKEEFAERKRASDKSGGKGETGIIVKGYSDLKIRFSHCCTPVPGDDIIGYVSRSRGVTIHRADCPNVKYLEPERLIEAVWPIGKNENKRFVATLGITAIDRTGLVVEVATLITNMKITMTTISAKSEKNGTASISVGADIGNINDLDNLIARIDALKDVTSVSRAAQGDIY